ncbi:hypothetical protein D3C75_1013580 [compost metagenome]
MDNINLGGDCQILTDQQMVEYLRVAVIGISVPLIKRQLVDQIVEFIAFKDCGSFGELEIVQISKSDNVCSRVSCQNLFDKAVYHCSNLMALCFTGEHWRLNISERTIIAGF